MRPANRNFLPGGSVLLLAALLSVLTPATGHSGVPLEYVLTIQTSLGDTTETFWLQIPSGYVANTGVPLLVGYHQLGGSYLELKEATQFDSICESRTWILAAPAGPVPSHWNNHAAQSHVADMIRWIEERYTIDTRRIYMVGASMGGGGGMVYADNHLDPGGPMVAAVASVSGIQDCERRFHEQGWNNSMVAAFGGTPEEVPFTYHRNSPICFADSTQSMHRNARHLPLLLSFGSGDTDAVWRAHAEDLHAAMIPFADEVMLHESSRPGHGWAGVEEDFVCDFLQSHVLPAPPHRISINGDEDGRWYWAELQRRDSLDAFGRFEVEADPALGLVDVAMVRNIASLTLDLAAVAIAPTPDGITIRWDFADGFPADLTLRAIETRPSAVYLDGAPFPSWEYDEAGAELTLHGSVGGEYIIFFETTSVPDPENAGDVLPGTPSDGQPAGGGCTGAGPGAESTGGSWLRAWWSPTGSIRYVTDAAGPVTCRVFDSNGRDCWMRTDESVPAGPGSLRLERVLPAGVYFVVLERPGRVPVRLKAPIVR